MISEFLLFGVAVMVGVINGIAGGGLIAFPALNLLKSQGIGLQFLS